MNKPVLMPQPNHLRFFGGHTIIRSGALAKINGEIERVYPGIVEIVKSRLGFDLKTSGTSAEAEIELTGIGDDAMRWICDNFQKDYPIADIKKESYFISIKSGKILLAANDKRGFFYALQTLEQLIVARDGASTEGITLKNAVVFDYPHMEVRGLHLYLPARENMGFCKRLIRGMAGLKYNRIYFETSGMEYKRHPEINAAWLEYSRDMDEFPEKAKAYQNGSHTDEFPWYKDSIHIENAGGKYLLQEEVRELIAFCMENLLEVVPEVQSLSHCDYLVIPHREIAENPEVPYPDSYCPSNPKSYELLSDVIDEVIEVFDPEIVNIGHDEWYGASYCPLCRGKDASELLAQDVEKIRNYLFAKGIKTEMWADKLLDAHTGDGRGHGGACSIVEDYQTSEVYNVLSATNGAIKKIPGDVILGHWYWGLEPNGFKYFAENGFKNTMFFNFEGAGVKDWEAQSREANVRGAVLSHWDLVEEDNMAREGTLTNVVFSSIPLWNENYNNTCWDYARDMTIQYMPYFMQKLGDRDLPSLSLKPKEWVHSQLRHEMKEKFYTDSAYVELRSYDCTLIQHRKKEKYFKDANVVIVKKAQSFCIAFMDDYADSLIFSHNTDISIPFRSADKGYRSGDYHLGYYTVLYEDESEIRIDLDYGRNISCKNAGWGRSGESEYDVAYSADIRLMQSVYYTRPWLKTLNNGENATVFDFEWINPCPGKRIREVKLTLSILSSPFSIDVYDIYGIKQKA